jgi:hypothetical protein
MNVGQLIKALSKFDKNVDLYISSDPEGNSYGEIDNVLGGDGEKYLIIYPVDNNFDYFDIEEKYE